LIIGPVCYTIFTEVSATKLRTKTIAVATAAQALVGIVMTVAIPHMINQANMRGKLGFFYGKHLYFSVFASRWKRIADQCYE
jgi:SP family general alpha glucoside:H+ symporter-like MFS transporter